MPSYVSYLRVSTDKQGRSGLGLEAQRAAIASFMRDGDTLRAEYVEIESGAARRRPQLAAAMARCRATNSTLCIAKLDRLGRRMSLISALMDDPSLPFLAVDNPHANRFSIHILAAVAEHERSMISDRTRQAMAAAKARGRAFGGDRGRRPSAAEAAEARQAASDRADRMAAAVVPAIREAIAGGAGTLAAVAMFLTAQGMAGPRGGGVTPTTVRRILCRHGASLAVLRGDLAAG